MRLATPLPIPQTTLPDPNGHDDLLRAAAVLGSPLPTGMSADAAGREVAARSEQVRAGKGRPGEKVPKAADMESRRRMKEDNPGFRNVARALCDLALCRLERRNDEAVDAYLDTIRLGRALQHGGLLDGLDRRGHLRGDGLAGDQETGGIALGQAVCCRSLGSPGVAGSAG